MPNYKYKAMSDTGSTVTGVIAAQDVAQARLLIASKGLIPQSVRGAGGGGAGSGGAGLPWVEEFNRRMAKVKAPDLMLFTKQLRTMLDAGLAMSRALDILEQQTSNLKLKHAAKTMQQDINQGASLYNAFNRHTGVFGHLYCSMVRAGEASGNLSEVFERLVYLIEHEYKVRSKIKSALTYPAIVVVALGGAFFFLLGFVIPKFITLFQNAHIELPLPTRICIEMNKILMAYWHVGLLGVVGIVAGLVVYCRTPQGRLQRDRLFLKVPLIGPVLQKAAMSRFTSIFAILQASGVSVLSSIPTISETIGNEAISREFDNLEDKLKEGRGISAPLKESRYFTPMVVNMISIGEESGNLDAMLQEVSKHYDYEVEYSVGRMSEMIGPLMVLGLSGVVGFFALAIMLPIFELTKLAH